VLRPGPHSSGHGPDLGIPLPLDPTQVRALLLDIEGTTTPVDFVVKVLFPYARTHVKEFLQNHLTDNEIRMDIARLREEHAEDIRRSQDPPPWCDESIAAVVAYIHWLMDRDRKSTGLKSLQGKIWEQGYSNGKLRGQVYTDVPVAFERWRKQGRAIAIFSSGSVLAQRLLFANSTAGDLTPFINAYFDTTTGPKIDSDSYLRIAAGLERASGEVLFVSDITAELDAAQHAGMQTALCVRSAESPIAAGSHPIIRTFDEICP
jgi:enolase-phosphatase E1